MRTNSPSTWRWAPADNNGSHTTWKSLADSECRLLDHAYQESWDRLELDIDGRPHVIDPFSSNAHIHVAVPLGNEGGPGALLARAMSVSIEGQRCTLPAHGLRSDRPSRWFPVSLREDAESEQKILRQPSLQQNYIGSPCESSADAAGVRHTSRRTISVVGCPSRPFRSQESPAADFEVHEDSMCTIPMLAWRGPCVCGVNAITASRCFLRACLSCRALRTPMASS